MMGSLERQQPIWYAYRLDLLVLDRFRSKLCVGMALLMEMIKG